MKLSKILQKLGKQSLSITNHQDADVYVGDDQYFITNVKYDSGDFYTYVMKDKEKGIEYIVVAGFSYGDGRSVAITPRLTNESE